MLRGGGPLLYTGRDMKTSRKGMRISASDWSVFMEHVSATLTHFEVPQPQRGEVTSFIESIKPEITEA